MQKKYMLKRVISIMLIAILITINIPTRINANEIKESAVEIGVQIEELERYIEYGEFLIEFSIVSYSNQSNLKQVIDNAKDAIEFESAIAQKTVLDKLIEVVESTAGIKTEEFWGFALSVKDKINETSNMDIRYYSEASLDYLQNIVGSVKYNLKTFFKSMTLFQIERWNNELESGIQKLELKFIKINSNETITNIESIFDPGMLEDGYYQIHKGTGWIKDENDLITSGVLEGDGSDNWIKLSKATSTNVTHGLDMNLSFEAEIKNMAAIGASVGFEWQPEQSFTTFTAATLMEASEDLTLYAKLYVMSEKLETYKIVDGKIVEQIESYNPIGTVGIYGEEEYAYKINILDYHVSEPVQVILGDMKSSPEGYGNPIQDIGSDSHSSLYDDINLDELTPMFHHEDVIKRDNNDEVSIVDEDYMLVDNGEDNHSGQAISSDAAEGEYTSLKNGEYIRFLGSGWVLGGDGHIATSTVMPGSIGIIEETIQDTFRVLHSIGIEVGVDVGVKDSKVKASISAAYTNDVETNEYITVQIRSEASSGNLKHIAVYENNQKYEVITVKDNIVVEKSEAYISDGIYAQVTEEKAPVILEDAEDRQVFNSLITHNFIPSISQNHDIFIAGALDTDFNKIFNAQISNYTADDSVNLHFRVEETGVYKFRAARVYGPTYTPNYTGYATALREPEYYIRPDYVKVFNIDSLTGRVNYEEYYQSAGGVAPSQGGIYYEVYLEKGEDYVIEVGPSTMTESFIPPGGYVPGYNQEVDPEDMYGTILEIEKTISRYTNAGEQLKLKEVLESYNTYKEEDYLKESFLVFNDIRNYANKLVERGMYASPFAIMETIDDLGEAAKNLIHIDDYEPEEPEFEYNPDEYYVKVNEDTELVEKVPAQKPEDLEDGVYIIDRGYGWIISEEKDLINTAVLDAGAEEGRVNVTKTVSTATSHYHSVDVYTGINFLKIFKIGLTTGFEHEYTDTKIINSEHILVVPEDSKGYLKVYTVNHKYETIQVEKGRVVYQATSYDPKGTIGFTAISQDGTINENNFIMKNDINIFDDSSDEIDIIDVNEADESINSDSEINFDGVFLEEESRRVNMPSYVKVGSTYRLNKTINQINEGQTPNATLIPEATLNIDGVYLQYLGDGFINGEESFTNTVTADPNIIASLETNIETKSYTEGGVNIEVGLEVGMFEAIVNTTYKFKQESGEKIGVGASTYDEDDKSQLKIYDMYKGYRVYEVKNGQIINEQFLSVGSGIYAKNFIPGDYSAALSEETERNTLSTSVSDFSNEEKNSYDGGADSIFSVKVLNDGTVSAINRIGFTLDTDISKLENGHYLIDLGDNWIQSDSQNLIGSNMNYNKTTSNTSTMNAIIEQDISTKIEHSGEGTLGLSKIYNDIFKLNNLNISINLIAGGGDSVIEGSESNIIMDIPENSDGLLKLYESSRRTDLVEIRNGQVVDRYSTYLENGIIAKALVGDSKTGINQGNAYIGESTKTTLSQAGVEKMEIHNEYSEYVPYIDLGNDESLSINEIKNDKYLSEVMYNSKTDELIDGTYSFYLGDWYSPNLLGTHYVTAKTSGELKQSLTKQSTWVIKTSAYVGAFKETVLKSVGGTFNKTIEDTYKITSGTRGNAITSDDLLKLNDRYQRFFNVIIKDGEIISEVIINVLIGTEGILEDA